MGNIVLSTILSGSQQHKSAKMGASLYKIYKHNTVIQAPHEIDYK
jgi:hypothetical protein